MVFKVSSRKILKRILRYHQWGFDEYVFGTFTCKHEVEFQHVSTHSCEFIELTHLTNINLKYKCQIPTHPQSYSKTSPARACYQNCNKTNKIF